MAATIDLRGLRLRAGETRRERLELGLDPFVLGGQRYELRPSPGGAELSISRASGAFVLELRVAAELAGPCMRCLGYAEVRLAASARELHDPAGPAGDPLRSEYVADEQLDVSAWARDALALEIPLQVLCRAECAGLCPECGRDLNLEPHSHPAPAGDPRLALLERLRDEL